MSRRSELGRRTTAAITLVAAGAAAGAVLAAPVAQAAPASCSSNLFITIRGTGEPQGFEPIILDPIASRLKSVTRYDLPYAAGADFDSSGAGGRLLADTLTQQAAACAGQRFVLGGYSQGGIVINTALRSLPASVTNRISAIVTFGNPFHTPNKSYNVGSGGSLTGLSARFGRTALDPFAAKVQDYCESDDPVCGGSGGGHLGYGKFADAAATFITRQIAGTTVPASPAASTPPAATPPAATPAPVTPSVGAPTASTAPPVVTPPSESPSTPPKKKKRGFWAWLFGDD